jgi:chaperonin GroEL
MELIQSVLSRPLARIAINAGRDPNEVVRRVAELGPIEGFDAVSGRFGDLRQAGIIDRCAWSRPRSSTRRRSPS